jgi:hypothetical protein
MADKATFTADEWKLLSQAPTMAALVVVAASPSGPLGVLQESMVVGKILADAKAQGSSSELINALVADLATPEGRQAIQSTELGGKSADQIKNYALDACRKAAALTDQKAPSESAAFKGWLQTIAQKVSEAAREGGFLGFGGTQVSAQETTALTDLRKSLGIAA